MRELIPELIDTRTWLRHEAAPWTKVCLSRWEMDPEVLYVVIDAISESAGLGRVFDPQNRSKAAQQWIFAKSETHPLEIELPDGRLVLSLVTKDFR